MSNSLVCKIWSSNHILLNTLWCGGWWGYAGTVAVSGRQVGETPFYWDPLLSLDGIHLGMLPVNLPRTIFFSLRRTHFRGMQSWNLTCSSIKAKSCGLPSMSVPLGRGSHARWRVAFIVTKTNSGQINSLTMKFHNCMRFNFFCFDKKFWSETFQHWVLLLLIFEISWKTSSEWKSVWQAW